MTVDTRCTIICDQGESLTGSLSEDHIDPTNVLAKVRGSIVLSGIKNLARGTPINVAYQVPGFDQVTRFPKRLRVLKSTVDPYEEVTNLEVGCLLSMKQDLKPREKYKGSDYPPGWFTELPERMREMVPVPIYAQGILTFCLEKLGITAAPGNAVLAAALLREEVDLSGGYVEMINSLLVSESCYGFINAAEQFVVRSILGTTASGPVLTRSELLTMEGVESGSEAPDVVEVEWDGGVQAADGIELDPVPLVPELPSSPGGELDLTEEQENEVASQIVSLAKAYGFSDDTARRVVNRGIIASGAVPDASGRISLTPAQFSLAIGKSNEYARGYSTNYQRAREYQDNPGSTLPPDESLPPPSGDEQGPGRPSPPRPLRDWSYDETASSDKTYSIQYVTEENGAYVQKTETASHASLSTTTAKYTAVSYVDRDGVQQSSDVVASRKTETTSIVGAVNPTRWKSKREQGGEARPSEVVTYRSETTYEHESTPDGPRTKKEITKEYEPRIAFGGGLGIQNWKGVDLGLSNIQRSETVTEYEWDDYADRTKIKVSRWLAWGSTSEGATGIAAIAKAIEDAFVDSDLSTYVAAINQLVSDAEALVFDGSETRISVGRGSVDSKPSKQEIARREFGFDPFSGGSGGGGIGGGGSSGGWPGRNAGNRVQIGLVAKQISGGFGDLDIGKTDTYELPFPADDVLTASSGGDELFPDSVINLDVQRGGVKEQARKFARTMEYLSFGHASGVAITTEIRNLPSEPLGFIFIDAAGVAATFRCNGTSWAWGGEGMIVGTDALLHGAAGKVGSTVFTDSWIPVPVAIADLAAAPASVSNPDPKPANTITTPNGFDPSNPVGLWGLLPTGGLDVPAVQRTAAAVVAPRNEVLLLGARTRSKVRAVVFDYPRNLGVESARAVSRTTARMVTEINLPTASLTLAGLAPEVAAKGVNVALPVAELAISALAPTVSAEGTLATVVSLPVAELAISALAPEVAQAGANVELPTASLQLSALAPTIENPGVVALPVTELQLMGLAPTVAQVGVNVELPVASLELTGLAPAVAQISVTDPSWANVSLLLPFNGANGSTTITDVSSNANAISVFGAAQITTTDPKFGTGALTLSGALNTYIQTPASALFQFGTGDFTVEFWVNPTNTGSNQGVFTFGGVSTGLFVALFQGNWYLGTGGSGGTNMGAAATGWQHVAITRSGSSLRMFIGGTQKGSTLTNSTNLSDNQLKIGYYYSTIYLFTGKLDEFRVTKGVARYTANFTAPTTAFPTS